MRRARSESGLVLIVVLIIIAVLMIYTVDMLFITQVHSNISDSAIGELKSRYAAKSGIHILGGVIKGNDLESIEAAALDLAGGSGNSYGKWMLELSLAPFENSSIDLRVEDERSKINLNSLINRDTNTINSRVQKELRTLFELLDIDSESSELFLASLVNWIDRPLGEIKNDQRKTGARAEFYLGLDRPYNIKDGFMDSLEELLLVNGMSQEFFDKIEPYVTVYPPDKEVNFSTAPKAVLVSVLKGAGVPTYETPEGVKEDMAEQIAMRIIEYRQEDPVVNRNEVRELIEEFGSELEIEDALEDSVYPSGKSDTFMVTSVGTFEESGMAVTTIEAVLRKSGPISEQNVDIMSWKER